MMTAAEIIRQLDNAFTEMNRFAVTAAQDAEVARTNARLASELAKRFSSNGNGNGIHLPFAPYKIHDDPSNNTMPLLLLQHPLSFASTNSPHSKTSVDPDRMAASAGGPVSSPPKAPPPPAASPHSKINMSLDALNFNSQSPTSRRIEPSPDRRRQQQQQQHGHRHAEEVLQLTLDLENSQRQLEDEQKSHDETRTKLHRAQLQMEQYKSQMDALVNQRETERYNTDRTVEGLEQELVRARMRIQEAEEFADEALATAKMNMTARQTAEQETEKLRETVRKLLLAKPKPPPPPTPPPPPPVPTIKETKSVEQQQISKSRRVRFADEEETDHAQEQKQQQQTRSSSMDVVAVADTQDTIDTNLTTSTRPTRALVAAGRQILLQRRRNLFRPEDDNQEEQKEDDAWLIVKSPAENEEAIQIREELRRRLQQYEKERLAAGSGNENDIVSQELKKSLETLEACRNTFVLLQESGKRLRLPGRWWSAGTTTSPSAFYPHSSSPLPQLASLARQYTTQVEMQMDLKNKEIRELDAFCSILENEMASTTKTDPPMTPPNNLFAS
jgi:hypothetical protein